jgi:hypothetical protein
MIPDVPGRPHQSLPSVAVSHCLMDRTSGSLAHVQIVVQGTLRAGALAVTEMPCTSAMPDSLFVLSRCSGPMRKNENP